MKKANNIPTTILNKLSLPMTLFFAIFCISTFSVEAQVGKNQSALSNAVKDNSNPISDAVVLVGGGCTGTLIAPRVVVTAGHCVNHSPPISGLPATNDGGSDWELPGVWYPLFDYSRGLQVQFGNDRSNIVYSVRARHYNHPGFADVILLGLEKPVPNSIAMPVSVMTDVPGGRRPKKFWRKKRFTMVGWGGTESSSRPQFRQRTTGSYGAYPHTSFGTRRPNQMLVKGDGGSEVIPGDSGGPLFWNRAGFPPGLLVGRTLVGTAQGRESGGGRYFVTWGPGGTDGDGNERPDLGDWYEEVLEEDIPARITTGDTQTFHVPVYGNNRVDWCLEWGNSCGEPAADAYCTLKGYDEAISHQKANNVGWYSPTYVIRDGRVCNDGHCDGFKQITCKAN